MDDSAANSAEEMPGRPLIRWIAVLGGGVALLLLVVVGLILWITNDQDRMRKAVEAP